jgi:hypothetical protein
MMSTRKLHFCGKVSSRSEASAQLKAAGDAVLVERGRPRLLILSCPCGCGEEFPINLDERAGPAWRLYENSRSGITVFPSVWRETGCKSHYVIWRNVILLFGQNEDEFDTVAPAEEVATLADSVLLQLPTKNLVPYADLANSLNAIPWDVLTACRRLVRLGLAKEGTGKQRGAFGRV